jgi:hypothetical protein
VTALLLTLADRVASTGVAVGLAAVAIAAAGRLSSWRRP